MWSCHVRLVEGYLELKCHMLVPDCFATPTPPEFGVAWLKVSPQCSYCSD